MALIIAGERSGVGKTTVTLTLLASLCRRSHQVQSFKVGPDYIDPMFHQHVTKRACRNLDPILTSETYVQQCFTRHSQGMDYALIEGVMGLFDGVSSLVSSHLSLAKHQEQMTNDIGQMTDYASTAHIARLLDLPVILVIDCSRLSGSVAAIAHGYNSFDPRIRIAGLILNRVGSDRHLQLLKDSLTPLQLPILGVLRRQDNITIPDRHLGLVPTVELPELNALIERFADLGDTCFDWERLLPLLRIEGQGDKGDKRDRGDRGDKGDKEDRGDKLLVCLSSIVKIAVARDRAFNFYYQDNLDLLQQLGAELVFWSPLEDPKLPEGVQGMYFGGGFPEVFAQNLAENTDAKAAIKTAILTGMPTIAECGGLMYLCEQVIDFAGKSWSMVGVLPTTAVMSGRLTLGYRRAVVLQDSLLVNAGTTVYGHEFHRSYLMSNFEQPLFETYRFDNEEFTGCEGWGSNSPHLNLHASYIHMHWGASSEIPQRFLRRCLE
ncbi:cobyrinic acid a,c-diamide synthase [Westiellopsis prolifica IICB1]|nr:cobyrinic acid a,c-diamide synthase [Westiellopsis prolifica IICB1]